MKLENLRESQQVHGYNEQEKSALTILFKLKEGSEQYLLPWAVWKQLKFEAQDEDYGILHFYFTGCCLVVRARLHWCIQVIEYAADYRLYGLSEIKADGDEVNWIRYVEDELDGGGEGTPTQDPEAVFIAMAKNKLTRPEILKDLAQRQDPRVRAAIAGNKATPAALLKTMVEADAEAEVLFEIASNSGDGHGNGPDSETLKAVYQKITRE